MRSFNLFTAEPTYPGDRPSGYQRGSVSVGAAIGASRLGATLYELPAGEAVCPYHYELGDEEWLIVLEGHPSVRHPDGEEELGPGDTVCFLEGESGAHSVTNRGELLARVLILSTKRWPAACVYPDSDKLGVFTEDGRDDLIVRRGERVGYWDGEERQ